MTFGIIGSGSWATALAKILTDKKQAVNWWIRNPDTIKHIDQRHHNPHYLSSVFFDVSLLNMSSDIRSVLAVPIPLSLGYLLRLSKKRLVI